MPILLFGPELRFMEEEARPEEEASKGKLLFLARLNVTFMVPDERLKNVSKPTMKITTICADSITGLVCFI